MTCVWMLRGICVTSLHHELKFIHSTRSLLDDYLLPSLYIERNKVVEFGAVIMHTNMHSACQCSLTDSVFDLITHY